jgi:hypothetical protein
MGVRLAAKAGVWFLALLLPALPVMTCTIPGAAMTTAERDCCKRMAEQCGHSGMAKSHGCCQTQVSPDNFHAVKAQSSQLDHPLLDLYTQTGEAQAIFDSRWMFTSSMPSPTNSPPGPLPLATTILRI